MIGLIWNCRGIGRPPAVRILKILIKRHRPHFLFLSKIKCHDDVKIQSLVKCLSFDYFECVPAVGKSGGLLLA